MNLALDLYEQFIVTMHVHDTLCKSLLYHAYDANQNALNTAQSANVRALLLRHQEVLQRVVHCLER